MSHILLIFIAEVPGWNSKYAHTVRRICFKKKEKNESSYLNPNSGTFLCCSGAKNLTGAEKMKSKEWLEETAMY